MLFVIFPLIAYFLICSLASATFKIHFGKMFPLALMAPTLVIFLSGVAIRTEGAFLIGYIIVACLVIAMATKCAFMFKEQSLSDRIKKYVLTPGLMAAIFFSSLCIGLAYIHGPNPIYWDEYAHWGQMVKELLRLEQFYTVDNTTLLFHNDYPPIVPLYESTWCFIAGRFDGRYVYAALWILQCSCLLPALEDILSIAKRSIRKSMLLSCLACLTLMLLICFPCFDLGVEGFFHSFYPDTVCSTLMVLGIYMIATPQQVNGLIGEKTRCLSIALLLCFLILVKQSMLIFVALLMAFYVIRLCILRKSIGLKWALIFLSLIVLLPCLFYLFWSILVKASTAPGVISAQFSISFSSLADLFSCLTSSADAYQWQVIKTYASAVLYRPIFTHILLTPSFAACTLLAFAYPIAASFIAHIWPRKISFLLGLVAAFSLILFATFMLVLYLVGFSRSDAENLVCYERYLSILPIAILVGFFLLSVEKLSRRRTKLPALTALSGTSIVLAVSLAIFPSAVSAIATAPNTTVEEFQQDGTMLSATLPEESTVLIINQGHDAFETLEIAYFADGIKVNRAVEGTMFSTQSNSWIASKDEMVQLLKTVDYVYCKNVDESFINKYGTLFTQPLVNGAILKSSEFILE